MIDLLWIGNLYRDTSYKSDNIRVVNTSDSIYEINVAIKNLLKEHTTDFILIWHEKLGKPNLEKIKQITQTPGDVWHAGLLLGMKGKPFLLNFIAPTWMFNKDPDDIHRITSFRMHAYGTLFKKEALRNIGLFDENFKTLEGAALDLGLRMIKGGAFIIFEPQIVSKEKLNNRVFIPLEDETKMLLKHYSRQQVMWALFRSLSYGYNMKEVVRELKRLRKFHISPQNTWERKIPDTHLPQNNYKISVIIPTLKRHFYVEKVLKAMRNQTIKPSEIIVIDEDLYPEFYAKFRDLPLKVITGSNIGQSTARNRGIRIAKCEYIMIADDDIDEIPSTLIEKHLLFIENFKTDVSCGTVRERGIDYTVHRFKPMIKSADFFPTNNVLLKKITIVKSGLFDENFDKGMQEDHDVGMRIYLKGYLMGINPFVEVFHHRAPLGGLRENKARKVTFSHARTSIFKFNIMHRTAIYLYLKYYESFQVKEELLLNIRGFFTIKGNFLKKVFKIIVASIYSPFLTYKLFRNYREAKKLLE